MVSDKRAAAAIEQLTTLLPPGWQLSAEETAATGGGRGIDAVARITAPDGASNWLLVEAKSTVEPRSVETLALQLRNYRLQSAGHPEAIPVVVAPFLAQRTRQRLEEAGLGYVDLTGNARLVSERPGLFIWTQGAAKNPSREKGPTRSLKGAKASRVVRALCDFRPPIGVMDLATRTKTDPGYVSRILGLLERQDLVKRISRGPIVEVDWPALIRQWAEDYSPFRVKPTQLLAIRGLPGLVEQLRNVKFTYAITGSFAAAKLAPIAAPRLLVCYVNGPPQAARQLDLRETETGANVLLVSPIDSVVYDRTWERDGIRFAAPSQIAADLLGSPGRGPAEGEALLKWMRENESGWRN